MPANSLLHITMPPPRKRCLSESLDVYIPRIHGHAEHSESRERDIDKMIELLIRIMPIDERMRQWLRLARVEGGFRNANRVASLKYLVPEWLIGRIKSDPWRGVGAAR